MQAKDARVRQAMGSTPYRTESRSKGWIGAIKNPIAQGYWPRSAMHFPSSGLAGLLPGRGEAYYFIVPTTVVVRRRAIG
jgi:hypothetical protein